MTENETPEQTEDEPTAATTIALTSVPDPYPGMTIEQMIDAERAEYPETTIKEVRDEGENFSLASEDGWSMWVNKDELKGWRENTDGGDPVPGMQLRTFGRAGRPFHGVEIANVIVWWQTPAERTVKRATFLAELDRRRRRRFAEQKAKLDADYEALPQPLKERIDRFREADPNFRINDEGYEMFCCREGQKIAEAAREAVEKERDTEDVDAFWSSEELRKKAASPSTLDETVWGEVPGDAEQRWILWAWALNTSAYDYDHERQRKVTGCDDGHSGNTFGGAMSLALRLTAGQPV